MLKNAILDDRHDFKIFRKMRLGDASLSVPRCSGVVLVGLPLWSRVCFPFRSFMFSLFCSDFRVVFRCVFLHLDTKNYENLRGCTRRAEISALIHCWNRGAVWLCF